MHILLEKMENYKYLVDLVSRANTCKLKRMMKREFTFDQR